MSRVGMLPVTIPEGVTVDIADSVMTAKGKLGVLSLTFVDDVSTVIEDGKLIVKPANDSITVSYTHLRAHET